MSINDRVNALVREWTFGISTMLSEAEVDLLRVVARKHLEAQHTATVHQLAKAALEAQCGSS